MKINQTISLFTIVFLLGSSIPNYAQQSTTNDGLIIEKKSIKSIDGKKLSPREIEVITKTLNDPDINTRVSNARTQINIGRGAMYVGVGLELIGLLTIKKDNLGLLEFSSSSTSLLVGGAVVLLGGVIVQGLGFNKLKSAATDYNNIKSGKKGITYIVKPIVMPSPNGVKVGVNMRF